MNNPESSAQSSRFIQLNFVNRSNSARNSPVTVLQKNGAQPEIAVAWEVIQNFRPGDNYQLVFPTVNEVTVYDNLGHSTPFMEVSPGNAFHLAMMPFGMQLNQRGPSRDPQAVEVTNELPQLPVDVCIFKGGALLSARVGLNPGQTASFIFQPVIFVGVTSDIEQGQVITSNAFANINTEISLIGISSADVVLTGGGSGSGATPYQFTLENVVMG